MTKDIGHYLEVPEEEREEVDPPPEYNADAGFDVQVVPNGEYVELKSASADEPVAYDSGDEDGDDDGSIGAPAEFLSPADPEWRN